MPSQLVTLLTYVFLALLYLFFLRVVRAVWLELKEPKAAADGSLPSFSHPGAGPAPSPPVEQGTGRDRGARHTMTIVEPPEMRGREFDLGDELTVGRAAGCSVSLPGDTFVSQLHARVFRRDGDLWVEDLGSTNGTSLNDKKVSAPVVMRRGDALKVGKTILELTQ